VTLNSSYCDEQAVVLFAHQQQKGIFVKKALASGHLDTLGASPDRVKHAIRFVLSQPGVTSVLIGTLNAAHLREAVEAV